MNPQRIPIAILGAGPAGLGAAYKLAQRPSLATTVFERGAFVGGNAGSFDLAGMRVDYGSHRLHPACAAEILADIQQMLGPDLLDRPRHGRIRLRGRWVHFPLKPADLALHLPPSFLAGIAVDSVRKLARRNAGDTFASVLEDGLGRTICRDFYFPYARKIWGVDPQALDAEQARRRVSAGSLGKMFRKALNSLPGFKKRGAGRFYYPKHGYGAISDAYAAAATSRGAELRLRTTVAAIETSNGRVESLRVAGSGDGAGGEQRISSRLICSTIPITQLARLIQPSAPADVLASAASLKFRAMILIYLVLETEQFTEYDAHYFPDAEIAITRLSEPKNYALTHNPGRTVVCAELPCSTEDAVWRAPDSELARTVSGALAVAGIPINSRIVEVASRKLPQAYPIYTRDYQRHFDRIDSWLDGIEGLVTFGRQGLFAHDNTHHALAMAYALDGCLADDGSWDRKRWEDCRRGFREHVVED
jgi:protoporphyrinogen oxidase